MRWITIFFLLLAISIGRCQVPVTVSFDELSKTERVPYLSEIAESASFVKLETNDDCLIDRISRIIRLDNHFIIATNKNKSLLLFDSLGNFVRRIGRVGKGPGEYSEIFSISVDRVTNSIYVLDNGRLALIEFDIQGNVLSEMRPDCYSTGVSVDNGIKTFYTSSVYTARSGGFHITMVDSKNQVIKQLHSRTVDQQLPDRVRAYYTLAGEIHYWEPYWDTVYTLKEDIILPAYYFDLGPTKLPKEYLNQSIGRQNIDRYRFMISYKDFSSFLYIEFIDHKRMGKRAIFNKKTGEGYFIPGSLEYLDWGVRDDISGIPLFPMTNRVSDTEVACSHEIADLIDYVKSGKLQSNNLKDEETHAFLKRLINESSINDNPILQIVNLK